MSDTSNGQATIYPAWCEVRVSMVGSAPETNTRTVVLSDIFEGIRTGRWKAFVDLIKETFTKAFETANKQGDPNPYRDRKRGRQRDQETTAWRAL